MKNKDKEKPKKPRKYKGAIALVYKLEAIHEKQLKKIVISNKVIGQANSINWDIGAQEGRIARICFNHLLIRR